MQKFLKIFFLTLLTILAIAGIFQILSLIE